MARATPTTPAAEGLAPALARNIDALVERRRLEAKAASREERAAAAISNFAGSMTFVYIHLVFFGGWIALNIGVVPIVQVCGGNISLHLCAYQSEPNGRCR
jgi:uncharacterized membrane protein